MNCFRTQKTAGEGIDVGVFDVSHMGEFEITGPDRNAFVNRVTCNDVGALEAGAVGGAFRDVDEGGSTFPMPRK